MCFAFFLAFLQIFQQCAFFFMRQIFVHFLTFFVHFFDFFQRIFLLFGTFFYTLFTQLFFCIFDPFLHFFFTILLFLEYCPTSLSCTVCHPLGSPHLDCRWRGPGTPPGTEVMGSLDAGRGGY